MRVKRLVNLLRSTRRAGKVEHMSSALALVGLTHISYMHSELPFMLELASSPLVKLPCSPQRTVQAFGRLARKWWLHELIGQQQRRQHFCTLQMGGGLRAVSVSSSSELDEAPQPRLSCSAVQSAAGCGSQPTSSRPHAGCTQRILVIGSFGVAYSARLARINRIRMPPLRSGEERWPRRCGLFCSVGAYRLLIESVPTRVCYIL